MPVYEYKGVNAAGKTIKGVVDAENSQAARAKLRKDNIFLTDLNEGGGSSASPSSSGSSSGPKSLSFGGGGVKSQDIAIMTRQLSTLISAGIPLDESLSALVEQTENIKLKQVISEVRERVNEGANLADSLRTHRKIFSNLYANMVMAGESSGTLGLVLDRLADFTEGQMKLRNKVIQVMVYPILMIVIGIIIMLILFTVVIPKVTQIYDSIGAVLPTPTLILINVSSFIIGYWYLLPIFAGLLIYSARAYMAKPAGRYNVHRWLLRIPLFGSLIRMMAVTRFTRTLGTLLSSGVPLLMALDIVKNVVTNLVISKVIEGARSWSKAAAN
jgi:general secretion pathway protein F